MQSQTDLYNIHTYTDSEFNPGAPELYSLDVFVAAHTLSFTVYNGTRVMGLRKLTSKINLFESSVSQFNHALAQLEWVSPAYRHVRVFIENARFTLVPEALFDSDKAATYFNLVHKNIEQEKILTSKLAKHSAVCVSGIENRLYDALRTAFGNPLVLHANQVLLHIAAQYSSSDLKNHLLLHLSEGFISVLYYHNNEIRFINTFVTESDTDIVYYVLSVITLLKLPQDKSGVILMGDISATSATLSLLKKYIPEVITANRVEDIRFPVSFREFQDHQHYLPIHSLLCE